jgi:hypothetical protein
VRLFFGEAVKAPHQKRRLFFNEDRQIFLLVHHCGILLLQSRLFSAQEIDSNPSPLDLSSQFRLAKSRRSRLDLFGEHVGYDPPRLFSRLLLLLLL